QPVLAGELAVGFGAVGADADHLSPSVFEHLVAVAKGTCLGGASHGVVLGIEIKHDSTLAAIIRQPHRCAILGRKWKVWCNAADTNLLTCRATRCILHPRLGGGILIAHDPLLIPS